MPVSFPIVNGNRYDYSSIRAVIAGAPFFGIAAINYKHALDPAEVYGLLAQPMGRTRGQYKAEGSMDVYREEWKDLLDLLALTGLGAGFMEVNFPIFVSYQEGVLGLQTDQLLGCRIKSADHSNSPGNGALVVKCELSIMSIVENAKMPVTGIRL